MLKRLFLILFFAQCIVLSAFAQDENRILGTWLSQNGDSKITINKYPEGNLYAGKYYGTITWLKVPNLNGKPKLDSKNPAINLQARPVLGLNLLVGFDYSPEDEEWIDGTLYQPTEGKTYKSVMWFESDLNKLYIKGYIGTSMIGKQFIWTKVQ